MQIQAHARHQLTPFQAVETAVLSATIQAATAQVRLARTKRPTRPLAIVTAGK